MGGLDVFHPAVRAWFEARFPLGPTEPQLRGWPAIASGRDTLIAAPTGSGKTLAAFLVCLDRFFREAEAGQAQRSWLPGDEAPGVLPEGTQVVYVSPLKALAVDIAKNLTGPLAEIRAHAEQLGLPAPEIRIQTRSGDTTQSERAAMLRKPPHILVTTPESLYLMVTAAKSRESLRGVHTVIVDEIHAVARDKRGSHLALTLERLSALCDTRPTRIGLSATQRPIDVIARLLVGAGPDASEADGSPRCQIVDEGHRRVLDVAIEVPGSELGAVASAEQWAEILDRIAEHASQHKTTLVFSNTRRLAERAAHQLGERIGEDEVCAHHGSLSKERRLRTEERLRAGDLKLLVATASLELGIDIGPVELVCQLGSPRSIATFLQRVGRSGHARGQTPKGRLFPTTRDELVECAALVRGMTAGRLDRVLPPEAPLDILAQQIVAECAAQEWKEASRSSTRWWSSCRRASPPVGAGGRPTCTAIASTACCARVEGRAWRHSRRVARFRTRPTTGWWPIRTTPSSERSTKTGPSRAWRATSSCWAPRPGGFVGWSRVSCACAMPRGCRRRSRSGSARRRPAARSSHARSRICAGRCRATSSRALPTRRSRRCCRTPASTSAALRRLCATCTRATSHSVRSPPGTRS
jgi:ATP-dependent Lhr-like helicase